MLCTDLLDRLGANDPASPDTEALTDLYVLLSDVQRDTDRIRKSVRDSLLDRLGPTSSGMIGSERSFGPRANGVV